MDQARKVSFEKTSQGGASSTRTSQPNCASTALISAGDGRDGVGAHAFGMDMILFF